MASILKKVQIPAFLVGFLIFLFIAEYYFWVPAEVSSLVKEMSGWSIIIASIILPLGAMNLINIHARHVMKRTAGRWYQSLWLLFVLAIGSVAGIYGTMKHPIFDWMYNNLDLAITTTLNSLLGFFIISAGYKAFRARNLDAALLLISATAVMLGNIPVGELIWRGMPDLSAWIMKVPNTAGMRGIIMSVGLAAIVLTLRIALGKELRYFGVSRETEGT